MGKVLLRERFLNCMQYFIMSFLCSLCGICAKGCNERELVDEYPAIELKCGSYSYLTIVVLLVALLGSRHDCFDFRSRGADICF